jgi:hypothetical protein
VRDNFSVTATPSHGFARTEEEEAMDLEFEVVDVDEF